MPMPNIDGGTPQNTVAQGIPLANKYLEDGSVPIRWGNDHYIDEDTLEWGNPQNMDRDAILAIPKVCRFIYGYDPETNPPENNWTGCGCPAIGDCPSIVCEWTVVHEVLGVKNQRNTVPLPNPDWFFYASEGGILLPGYLGGQLYEHVGDYPSIHVKIQDGGFLGEVIYEGPMSGCPYYEPRYLHRLVWTKRCYGKLEDDSPDYDDPRTQVGCPSTVTYTFVDKGYTGAIEELCSRNIQAVHNLELIPFLGSRWSADFISATVVAASDYPPYYGTGCTPGPGPCP